MEISDRPLDTAGDHHRARLAADLVERDHLLLKMVDHDFGLQPDRMVMTFDVMPQLLVGALAIELGIVFDLLYELIVAVDRRVILQHIADEAFIDRLFHRVAMERCCCP